MYRPESAVFWLYVAALLIGTFGLLLEYGAAVHDTMAAQIVLGPIWLGFIVFLVWVMYRFDPYRSVRHRPQVLVAGTALGGTVALLMAANGNTAMGAVLARYLDPDIAAQWTPAFTAPFIEEASKALCAAVVLVLSARVFNRISHALLLGMFVGFGFDIMEDVSYTTNDALSSLDSDLAGAGGNLLVRILTAVPAHWAYTALATVAVLLLLPSFAGRTSWTWFQRIPAALALFGSASLMHFVWDAPVPGNIWVKFAVNIAIFGVAVTLLLRAERRWIVDRIETRRDAAPLAGIDAAVLDSLPTRRSRRAFQKQARKAGGRKSKKVARRQQDAALDVIQATG